MLTEARQIAIGRMVEDAEAKGANDYWDAINVIISDEWSSRNGRYGTAVVIND